MPQKSLYSGIEYYAYLEAFVTQRYRLLRFLEDQCSWPLHYQEVQVRRPVCNRGDVKKVHSNLHYIKDTIRFGPEFEELEKMLRSLPPPRNITTKKSKSAVVDAIRIDFKPFY